MRAYPHIPDPYDPPKLKRGVYPCPANPPGWISYMVVDSNGEVLGQFGMQDHLLGTSVRRDAFERRLRKFLNANDIPSVKIVRAG